MITIEKALPSFALAGNPVLIKLISDNFISTSGSKAYLRLEIGDGTDTTAGHSFMLSFGSFELTFTAAVTPDDTGLQYEAATGSDTFNTWAEKLYNAFLSNYFLSKYFAITLGDAGTFTRDIMFLAKEKGSDYTLTFVNDDATEIAEATKTDGIDPVYRENFGIVASLWDGTTKIAEDVKSVDTSGRATFNFSEYLISLLETDDPRFTWPEVTDTFVHQFINYVQSYRISYAEKYSGQYRKLVYDSIRHAIAGGLSRETLSVYNEAGDHFFDDTDNKKRFLTWAPVMREIGYDVPQKLFFVFQTVTGYSQYRLCASVVFEDGTIQKKYCSALSTITPWSVVECVAGYDQLSLGQLDPTQEVVRWYIFLENESGVQISESRGYTLDPDYYEFQRFFLFRNSFSAYDIVRFTGKGELNPEYERVSGYRDIEDDYTSLNAPLKLFSAIESQKMKANSGWITLEEKKHLRDFLLSRESYEIIDDKIYPIIVTSLKPKEFLVDGVTLYSLEIEYERAYNDMFWSDILEALPATVVPERIYSDDYNVIEYS